MIPQEPNPFMYKSFEGIRFLYGWLLIFQHHVEYEKAMLRWARVCAELRQPPHPTQLVDILKLPTARERSEREREAEAKAKVVKTVAKDDGGRQHLPCNNFS